MNGFISIEKRDTIKHTQRALSALYNEIKNLDIIVADYAAWDDSYQFIQDGNQAFIDATLPVTTFNSLKVNVILYVQFPNTIIFAKAVDLDSGEEMAFPKGLDAHLSSDSPLLKQLDTPQHHSSGVLVIPEGILLISSRPILTSERKGPVNGVIIMGRYLDDPAIQRLSDVTQLSLSIQRIDSSNMPIDFQKAISNFSHENPIVVDTLSSNLISGYVQVQDLYQKTCMIIRMNSSRDIFQQGHLTINYFIVSVLMIGFVLGLVILFLIERIILSRLSRLDKEIKTIQNEKDLSARVLVRGKDELTHFSETINEMLGALEQSQIELKSHRDILEELVKNRTQELRNTNQCLRDEIVERQRLSEELQKAKDAAESASRAKTTFLANMSHELRTPLNIILGYAKILEHYPELSKKEQEAVHAIYQSGEALLTMINDLLDITKIEKQEIQLEPGEFHLPNWLRKIFDFHRIQAKEKGLVLDFDTDPELPDMVYGDEKRLRQVLRNLLINAIKFTKQGRVIIKVKCVDMVNQKCARVRFEIQDTGIGISQDRLEKIFDAFHSIDTDRLYSDGVGIGLNLSQRLLALMGGTLYVESTPNKGSIFWFEIQLQFVEHYTKTDESDYPEALEQVEISETLIVPPIEELKILYDFSQMGDIDSIITHIMMLKKENPKYGVFIDKLNFFAENFMIEEIQEFIYAYINRSTE